MNISEDQYIGCFLGLALGDALGAPYEGGIVEQLLWRVIGRTRKGELRFTDDTQMSLDLAQSLLAKQALDQDDLAQRFAQSYHWSRGYGPSAARLLKQVRKGKAWQVANKQRYPQGSLGNGAAMRAPIIALFKPYSLAEMTQATRLSAEVTHAHPLGIEGAVLIALTTTLLLQKPENPLAVLPQCEAPEFKECLQVARTWLETREPVKAKQVAKTLG
ncbi:MAG TPA: ADP-ribosylglycohydrolase family protein, partial [Thiolinea sp.]|nr:ADP-ribosylglycohydrolase family protein [Thiolinea sp.]